MIGVSLGARTTAKAKAALQEISRSADIAELRLDFMTEYDLAVLLRDRPCPVIVTNRPEREGGRFRGSEAERIKPLRAAIDLGAEYVDIEHDAVALIPERGQTRLIVSYHDFEQTPANLVEIYRQIAAKGADVVKVVGMARSVADNLRVFEALDQADRPTIAIAMGEAGLIGRVLALRYESCFLTYATLGSGERVAPGQLAVATMREVYQAEKIDRETAIFGVLGAEAISDERLATLNRATREAGVNGVWVPFVASEKAGDDPVAVARAYRRLGVAGYLVRESAQLAVRPALDRVESGGPAGQVNVIRAVGTYLVGSWVPALPDAFAAITGQSAGLSRVPMRL